MSSPCKGMECDLTSRLRLRSADKGGSAGKEAGGLDQAGPDCQGSATLG